MTMVYYTHIYIGVRSGFLHKPIHSYETERMCYHALSLKCIVNSQEWICKQSDNKDKSNVCDQSEGKGSASLARDLRVN